MRGIFYLVVGLIFVWEIIARLTGCIACDSNLFGYEVSGYTHLAFNVGMAVFIFRSAYKEYQKTKKPTT